MAETSGFYNGTTAGYGQEELFAFFNASFRSGIQVYDNGSMGYKVTAGTGNVRVAPGYANVAGGFHRLTTEKTVTVPTPSSYARIDRIVIRQDFSAKNCSVVLKQGTPASTPQPPALQRDTVRWELSLAQIRVTITGTITVTDERMYKDLCGGLRPNGNTEFELWFKQMQEVVESWFRTQQGTGWRQIFYIKQGEPFPDEAEVGALCRVIKS